MSPREHWAVTAVRPTGLLVLPTRRGHTSSCLHTRERPCVGQPARSAGSVREWFNTSRAWDGDRLLASCAHGLLASCYTSTRETLGFTPPPRPSVHLLGCSPVARRALAIPVGRPLEICLRPFLSGPLRRRSASDVNARAPAGPEYLTPGRPNLARPGQMCFQVSQIVVSALD